MGRGYELVRKGVTACIWVSASWEADRTLFPFSATRSSIAVSTRVHTAKCISVLKVPEIIFTYFT